jgi:hypothetical protein
MVRQYHKGEWSFGYACLSTLTPGPLRYQNRLMDLLPVADVGFNSKLDASQMNVKKLAKKRREEEEIKRK